MVSTAGPGGGEGGRGEDAAGRGGVGLCRRREGRGSSGELGVWTGGLPRLGDGRRGAPDGRLGGDGELTELRVYMGGGGGKLWRVLEIEDGGGVTAHEPALNEGDPRDRTTERR